MPKNIVESYINTSKNKYETRYLLTPLYLKPNPFTYEVVQTKEFPLEGTQLAKGWTKWYRPIVKTRKVFATVQINLGSRARPFLRWIDARDLILATPVKKLNGINLGLIG